MGRFGGHMPLHYLFILTKEMFVSVAKRIVKWSALCLGVLSSS